MLKLERLELSGFKSFVDPVSVDFAGGLTAIVGPNGCGKSNLSDAMSWVMGEQSAKSLRGGTMEDVIFNGSASRRPLGMAEATLTLRTDPAFEHSEDGKITLGRRVFRSGESQYRLNGKMVRLKDTKDLLMDTGLGIRAYSVIEQGKIGMILSTKPQERRKLLEEAAGITRYKARKRVAEVKLEEAIANLLRLDDIVLEIERALRSLKRQAGAARRYKEKQEQYLELLRRVLVGRWALLHTEAQGLEERLAGGGADETELATALSRDEAALAVGREALDKQAGALAQCHQRRSDLAATIEGRQEFLKSSRQTLAEIGERAAGGRTLAQRRQEEGESQGRLLADHRQRHQEILAERDRAAAAVEDDQSQIETAETDLRAAQERLDGLRQDLLTASNEQVHLRNRLHQAQIEQEKANTRLHHLRQELEGADFELKAADEALATANEAVTALQAQVAEHETRLQRVGASLDEVLRKEAKAAERKGRLAEDLAKQRQRREVLQQLIQAHAQRRRNLEKALAGAGFDQPVYLADHLQAVEGWEAALDFYLGNLADAVLLEDADADSESVLRLAAFLAEHVAGGGATSLLRPVAPSARASQGAQSPHGESFDLQDPAVMLSLGQALGLPPNLARALPPAFLVENPKDAARLAHNHPGMAFLCRDGLWAEGGLIHVEGKEAIPGVLARERELARLDQAIPKVEGELATAESAIEELVAVRAGHAREKNQLEEALHQLRRDLAVSQARHQDAAGRQASLSEELGRLAAQRTELEPQIAGLAERQKGLARELEDAEGRHTNLGEAVGRAQQEVETAKEQREALRTASAGRRGRLDVLQERLDSVDAEVQRLVAALDDGERQARLWIEEAERLESRSRELNEARERAERELQQALESREAADQEVILEQEKLDDLRTDLKTLEERIATCRERRDEVRGELEDLRIRRASLSQNSEHLANAFAEEFGPKPEVGFQGAVDEDENSAEADGATAKTAEADPAEEAPVPLAPEDPKLEEDDPSGERSEGTESPAAEVPDEVSPQALISAEPGAAEPTPELPALEADMATVKATLERLGPVNVLAVEEYAEQEERHGFLTTQRQDVEESVTSLRRTIREINEESGSRFRTTFAEVNRSFGEVFQRLFRGGEAEMRLMDEDDVLESGIEIVARPPGKRLQNIQLMSGGEKALTAIALLFALFRTKPSPFCILDEVDAPLDDANTVRFVELLKEMAQDTQFLVITHNKITMEVCSTLYGVTMEESGVSKLVSVEIDEVHPEARAANTSELVPQAATA